MVLYRRNRAAGGTYFLTATLRDRHSGMLIEHIHLLRASFRETMRARPFTIDAIVVMPEHFHLLCTLPADDSDYSNRIRTIKRGFTSNLLSSGIALAGDGRGERSLWQRRFWEHTARDENDYARHVDYIHFNPVKHGLVKAVNDWPHSSFHRHVRQGLLPENWAGTVDAESGHGAFGEP